MYPRTALLIFTLACLSVHADRLHVNLIAPELTHRTFQTKEVPANSFGATSADPKAAALSFVSKTFGLTPRDYVVTSAYTTKDVGVTHVYLRQLYKGVEVLNADMNINVDREGNIISYGNSFFPSSSSSEAQDVKTWFSSSSGFVSPTKAFNTLTKYLKLKTPTNMKETAINGLNGNPKYEIDGVPFAEEKVKAEQAYVQLSDSKLVPAWKFNVRMSDNWFDACVHADGSKVVFLNDWVSDYSYNVVPINKNDPLQGRTLLVNPEKLSSSPLGWEKENETSPESGTTKGNNVYAQENWANKGDTSNNHRPNAVDGVFDFALDLTKEPKENVDAAITNLFYVCNSIHDILYPYGFDEAAGNFQVNNFNKGGKGGDYVIANAQDGSGTNNANFATPPDGQNGKMRMYNFDMTKPGRDGDFEGAVIIHEYGHGVSNRLTGGPANSNCLGWGQPGGMGEGWSDFFSILFQMKPESTADVDVAVGSYVVGKPAGIRKYPYSTSLARNPNTYDSVNGQWEVHAIGEIWCNILFEVYWSLFESVGKKFNPDLFSVDLTSANTLFLKILLDAMKHQPCSPTFIDARDAIIAATKIVAPNHVCAVWRGFAKRGMGFSATKKPVKGANDLPTECKQ